MYFVYQQLAGNLRKYLLQLYSQPLDVVLGLLPDELDSLQDICDIVDASLLDLQNLRGPVEVEDAVGRLLDQAHKLLGQQAQGGVVPRPLNWRLWS